MVTSIDSAVHPDLSEIVRRLVQVLQPERIYLFGSQARETARWDSDYDLLVLVSDPDDTSSHRISQAYDALWGTSVPADIIVQTVDYFDSRSHLRASLAGTVLREGKLIYASS